MCAPIYIPLQKTTQLEEVIDQQKQELDFLRGQVNTLTTTPVPPTLAEEDKSQSGDSAVGSISQSAVVGAVGSPGTLRRQLIKMQHALKVLNIAWLLFCVALRACRKRGV